MISGERAQIIFFFPSYASQMKISRSRLFSPENRFGACLRQVQTNCIAVTSTDQRSTFGVQTFQNKIHNSVFSVCSFAHLLCVHTIFEQNLFLRVKDQPPQNEVPYPPPKRRTTTQARQWSLSTFRIRYIHGLPFWKPDRSLKKTILRDSPALKYVT